MTQRILVVGTSRPYDRVAQQAARRVGTALARAGFGLITGNATGVDYAVASSFCWELRRTHRPQTPWYCQLALPFFLRGSFFPGRGYTVPPEATITVESVDEWIERAISLSAALVVIGGQKGALAITRRFMDTDKPVFPLPFTGGRSGYVFHDILSTWHTAPVPHLTQTQFLRLAMPWTSSGSAALTRLLHGTLAETPDIFISYRRADTAMACGRLHDDLIEHYGTKRVFMDLPDIAPTEQWSDSIERGLSKCKVGIVLIGDRWLQQDAAGTIRLKTEGDVVRHEIATLLENKKRIIPVLVDQTTFPRLDELPEGLYPIRSFQIVTLNNTNWDISVQQIIRSIDDVIQQNVNNRP